MPTGDLSRGSRSDARRPASTRRDVPPPACLPGDDYLWPGERPQGSSRFTRKKLIFLLVLLLVPVCAALIVYALAKSEPAVYSRAGATLRDRAAREAALKQFDEDVFNHINNVLLDKSGETLLNVTVTEEMINARLWQYLDEAARNGEHVSTKLATLRVAFEPGCMVLATRVGQGATSVIATQEVRLIATEEGLLRIEMGELRAGKIPVPSGMAEEYRAGMRAMVNRPQKAEGESAVEDLLRTVLSALDGKPVPLGRGKNQLFLDRIGTKRGSLHVEGHKVTAKRDAAR